MNNYTLLKIFFSFISIILHRLLAHPSRTFNREEAHKFFIPYDITADAYYHNNQYLEKVISLLNTSADFVSSQGANHFFVDSSEPFWLNSK